MFEEENFNYWHKKLIHSKDKRETFLKQRDFSLSLKKRKSVETTSEVEPIEEYFFISNDVWYNVSNYIPPEFVQTFALICQQTAAISRTKTFWRNIYKKYCQTNGEKWVLQLPANLQLDEIRNHHPDVFRVRAIESLFHCYLPMMSRLNSYNLEFLIGRVYVSAWHELKDNCEWILCYQFRQKNLPFHYETTTDFTEEELVNDWEVLAVSETSETTSNPGKSFSYEGVCLLVIFSNRFIPFASQLSYENAKTLQLCDFRRPITTCLTEYNLELDFYDKINKTTFTVKYPALKHKVLPWWHPEFKKYIKLEAFATK